MITNEEDVWIKKLLGKKAGQNEATIGIGAVGYSKSNEPVFKRIGKEVKEILAQTEMIVMVMKGISNYFLGPMESQEEAPQNSPLPNYKDIFWTEFIKRDLNQIKKNNSKVGEELIRLVKELGLKDEGIRITSKGN